MDKAPENPPWVAISSRRGWWVWGILVAASLIALVAAVVQIANAGEQGHQGQHIRDIVFAVALLILFLSFAVRRALQRPTLLLAGATILGLAVLDLVRRFVR